MQDMNIFGVPHELGGSSGDKSKDFSNAEVKEVLTDLVDMVQQFDDGDIQNFKIRKSFAHFDPYNPDESLAYSAMKFEEEPKLRVSIVLDFYRKQIEEIDEQELSFSDKERKEKVIKLIEFMSSFKVIDAPVLLKLYDVYK